LQAVDAAGLLLAAWVGTCGQIFNRKTLETFEEFKFFQVFRCKKLSSLNISFLGDQSIFQVGSKKLSPTSLAIHPTSTKVWYQMFVAALAVSLPFQLGAEGWVMDG